MTLVAETLQPHNLDTFSKLVHPDVQSSLTTRIDTMSTDLARGLTNTAVTPDQAQPVLHNILVRGVNAECAILDQTQSAAQKEQTQAFMDAFNAGFTYKGNWDNQGLTLYFQANGIDNPAQKLDFIVGLQTQNTLNVRSDILQTLSQLPILNDARNALGNPEQNSVAVAKLTALRDELLVLEAGPLSRYKYAVRIEETMARMGVELPDAWEHIADGTQTLIGQQIETAMTTNKGYDLLKTPTTQRLLRQTVTAAYIKNGVIPTEKPKDGTPATVQAAMKEQDTARSGTVAGLRLDKGLRQLVTNGDGSKMDIKVAPFVDLINASSIKGNAADRELVITRGERAFLSGAFVQTLLANTPENAYSAAEIAQRLKILPGGDQLVVDLAEAVVTAFAEGQEDAALIKQNEIDQNLRAAGLPTIADALAQRTQTDKTHLNEEQRGLQQARQTIKMEDTATQLHQLEVGQAEEKPPINLDQALDALKTAIDNGTLSSEQQQKLMLLKLELQSRQ